MQYKDFILKYLFVIFMGFVVFYIDSLEFVHDLFTMILILLLVIFKSIFFFIQSLKKILDATKKDVAYYNFLVFMAINVALIILSFGVDFLCVYQVKPSSFVGIPVDISFGRKLFELMYFSLLNFSNFGFGDITPVSIFAKVIVSIEIIISFITIIFILSDFVSLKESFAKNNYDLPFRREKKRSENDRSTI